METREKKDLHTSADFADFWAMYPRKVARKYASQCWARLTGEQRMAAINSLPIHIKAWESEGRAHSVIPHASTWINGERWEDEIETSQPIPQKAVAWWASEEGIMSKGRELGINAKGGESMNQFKARVVEAARRAA